MPVAATQMLPTDNRIRSGTCFATATSLGEGRIRPPPETIHTCQRPTAPDTMKNAPRALSPAKKMPIPMTTTIPNTTNNHESRRATHPSFSFTSPTVLVANPGTLPGHTSTSHGELCAVLDPCVFGFVGFITTDGLPILTLAMWLLGVVVGAGVVLFNAVGLVRVSRHAESVSCRARDETRPAALMYGLPWFRGWKDDRVARRRLIFMTVWGILLGTAILADSWGYRP